MYTGVWAHDPIGINLSRRYDPGNRMRTTVVGLELTSSVPFLAVQATRYTMELTCLASGHAGCGARPFLYGMPPPLRTSWHPITISI